MRIIFIVFVVLYTNFWVEAQDTITDKEKAEIVSIVDKQVAAWNEGNLEKFMDTYWKSNKLVFVGGRGPTYGWQATLDNYKKSYPNKEAMGTLELKLLELSKIDTKTVFLIGRFELTRKIGDLAGHFTLIIQKIGGRWVIVSDHSSAE